MKARFVQHYVPKPVGLDRLTTPYTPDFFKQYGAILYQFLTAVKGSDLLPMEVKYGYKFYLMDDPGKESVFTYLLKVVIGLSDIDQRNGRTRRCVIVVVPV